MRGGEKVLLSLVRLFPQAPVFTLLHVRGSVAPEIEAREIRTSFVQRLPGRRHALPALPAPLPRRRRVARPARLRPRPLELALRGQGRPPRGRRAAPVLLPHAHAVRVGPLRRLLRPRPRVAPLPPGDPPDRRAPARVGRAHCRPRPPLRRQQRLRRRAHPPLLRPRRRGHPTPRRHGVLHARRRTAPGPTTSSSPPSPPTSGSSSCSTPTAAPAGRCAIVGSGPEAARLRALAPPEAAFLGQLSDEELREQYRGCRAVLMPGVEDAGIVPFEALACGRPAIVFGEGGGAETIEPGRTGLVFHDAHRRGAARRRFYPRIGPL